MPRKRRAFDATWLPFSVTIGFALALGVVLPVTGSVLFTAGAGVVLSAVLGTVLGLRPRRRHPSTSQNRTSPRSRSHGDD